MRGAIEFLWGLIPQKDDDPVQLWEWRWKSVVLGILALALACYSSNLIPWMPPPYALANTVIEAKADLQRKIDTTNGKVDTANEQLSQVASQLKDGQVRSLNSDLIDARRYQCRGINSDDKASLPFWNTRLQTLKLAYQRLAGESWPELPCNSF
jgi:hypothetical protein